jgi:hypothetical protein
MNKLTFILMLAAFAAGTIPVMTSVSAEAKCSYTMNSGKARWSC